MSARNAVLASVALCSALSLPALAEGPSFSLDLGYSALNNASQSAKAIFDSTGGITFGAAIRKPFGDSLFVELGARVFSKDGERAFVADKAGPAFRMGHPLSVRLVPIQATFGYRLAHGAFEPWIGLGGGMVMYKETSSVAGVAEPDISQTKASGHMVLGVDRRMGGARVGLAVSYSIVPSSLGVGGVSQIYEEKDIGGFTALLRVGFGGGQSSRP